MVHYLLTFLSIILQAVLEKQSYMLIGRHDIEKLMRIDPSSAYLPNLLGQLNVESNSSDAETIEAELELGELLLNLRPIKQVCFSVYTNKLLFLLNDIIFFLFFSGILLNTLGFLPIYYASLVTLLYFCFRKT